MNITLSNVSKTFNGKKTTLSALAPVDLEIASGEFICIIGPSGCGKSTLLRLVADQISPTSGEILLDKHSPAEARRRKAIGWMAQNPALLPWSTVLENIKLPQKLTSNQQRQAPDPQKLLDLMSLTEFAHTYPGELSGGMQQRVALARTLATGAPIWLMDEPFAALDQLTREILADEVLQLWEKSHPTVLWVTHNISEAVHLADRVIVLTKRPGQVKSIVTVQIPRPREETAPQTIALVKTLRKLLFTKREKENGTRNSRELH